MRIQMCCAAAVMVGLFLGDFSYAEGLVFHYDPDTGNVSFDTSETRNGSTMLFSLSLHTTCEGSTSNLGGSRMTDEEFALCEATRVSTSGVEFRPENYIALSQSSISESTNFQVGEATFAQPWSGVYSIGEILPPGLDESTWTSLFRNNTGGGRRYPDSGTHIYTDVVGGGNPVPAEFVYGRPDVEYDNRWDLVDPDSLDWAEQAKLIYRQSTGELIFDTSGDSGGYSTSFLIRSSGGDLLHENFESPFESSFEHINSSNGVILLGDAIEPGQINLGQLLPAGLTERSFEDAISDAVFVGRAGFGERAVDFETDGTALSLVFSTSVDWTKCDLNGDAGCDVADLDELYSLMSSSRIEADLNADGAVDQSDINEWLVAASDSLNPAKTRSTDVYEPGDVDLNGVVDRIDLGLVLNSFGESDANGWSQGNLDGIDGVDSRDLGLVLNSFTSSSSSSVAVPEPMGAMPLAFLGLGLWMALRRRQ